MSLSPSLLSILRCPESGQPLQLAPEELLHSINTQITTGNFHNCAGDTVTESLTAALLREDHTLLYPIRDGFPILLTDQALPVDPDS